MTIAPVSPGASGAAETPSDAGRGADSWDREEWVAHAACRGVDPDALFVRGAAQREAAAICRHCPVMMQCRADALDNRVEFGVWGGLTERERRSLLREHPNIRSWADFFATAKERFTERRGRRQTRASVS